MPASVCESLKGKSLVDVKSVKTMFKCIKSTVLTCKQKKGKKRDTEPKNIPNVAFSLFCTLLQNLFQKILDFDFHTSFRVIQI